MTQTTLRTIVVILSLAILPSVGAQQPSDSLPQTQSVATKDPTALAIVARALSIAGGENWTKVHDYQLTATAKLWTFTPRAWPILISGRSTGEYRLEVDGDGPSGTRVEIINGTRGQYSGAKAAAQSMHQYNALSAPIYFPLPYLAEIVASPHIVISSRGTTTLNGHSVYQVDANAVFSTQTSGQRSYLDHFTLRSLFFDSGTGLLVRISDYIYSTKYASSRQPRTIDFSDYQTEHNLTFPHVIEEHVGLRSLNKIEVQSIVLNSGMPDSSFAFQY